MDFPKVLIVVRCFIKKDGKILLLRRAKEERSNPGEWELPGGKVETGQDLSSAAEKEALEETGLLVKITSPKTYSETGINPPIKDGVPHKYPGMLHVGLTYEARVVSGRVKLSAEHFEYKWVDSKEVLDFDLTLYSRKAITFFLDSD